MFCMQCGIKRKKGEQCCSNCGRRFEPLVSLGVPAGFPGIYNGMKNQEKDDSESYSDITPDSFVPLSNDSSDLDSENSGNQTINCKFIIKNLFSFFALSTIIVVIVVVVTGQSVKNNETVSDNINDGANTSGSITEEEFSSNTFRTGTDYDAISDEVSTLQNTTLGSSDN